MQTALPLRYCQVSFRGTSAAFIIAHVSFNFLARQITAYLRENFREEGRGRITQEALFVEIIPVCPPRRCDIQEREEEFLNECWKRNGNDGESRQASSYEVSPRRSRFFPFKTFELCTTTREMKNTRLDSKISIPCDLVFRYTSLTFFRGRKGEGKEWKNIIRNITQCSCENIPRSIREGLFTSRE